MNRLVRFLKRVLMVMSAPAWAIEIPWDEEFPTRTMEQEPFSFDPDTGTIRWTRTGTTEPFYLTIDGMVQNSVRLGYAELRALPSTSQTSDFHCVEGWTVPQVHWSGIRFQELLALVKPREGADFVVFHSLGQTSSAPAGQQHYIECLGVQDLLDPSQKILLALGMDGEPLSYDRGAPVRVVTPYRQAYKAAKFVHRMEFTDRPQPGWWTLANPIYDFDARVPAYRLQESSEKR